MLISASVKGIDFDLTLSGAQLALYGTEDGFRYGDVTIKRDGDGEAHALITIDWPTQEVVRGKIEGCSLVFTVEVD